MKAILRSGFLALAIMGLAVPGNAAAERFGPFIYDPRSPKDLKLGGPIDPRSALNFRRALDAHPEIERLYLDSAGGSVQTALLIADDVHRAEISTFIESNARCYSACAYIFFAGQARQIVGRLGVHQISAEDRNADDENLQINLFDVVEALNKYGVDPKVLEYMLRTPSAEIYIFTQQEIARLSLNRNSQTALRPTKQDNSAILENLKQAKAAYDQTDYAKALRLSRPLAEQGYVDAQYILGQLYSYGRGVRTDWAKAVDWYRKAAEQNHADAQYALGVMYYNGLGVSLDDTEAVKWFCKAAEQKHAWAQWYLGHMYRVGRGVPQDIVQSHMWTNLAAAHNLNLAEGARDILASKMTSDQLAEAQRMAREWMAKHQQ